MIAVVGRRERVLVQIAVSASYSLVPGSCVADCYRIPRQLVLLLGEIGEDVSSDDVAVRRGLNELRMSYTAFSVGMFGTV